MGSGWWMGVSTAGVFPDYFFGFARMEMGWGGVGCEIRGRVRMECVSEKGGGYGRYEIRGNNNCFWFVLGGRSGCSQLWRMGYQMRGIWR